ncbi:MAG: helix-turn-helix transcriptional regulator [Oscillospiraceae bacterium]|nr:helix-turn-helix transcriptional regulator [Oscillospiraceae bacterium]
MTLGSKIKTERKKLNLTQQNLADIMYVSREAIAKWESENGTPSLENLVAISEISGKSTDYFLEEYKQNCSMTTISKNTIPNQGGIKMINYDSINIFLNQYNKRFGEISPILQNAANTYNSDFSVILTQSYFDLLAEFINYQKTFHDLIELAVLKSNDMHLKNILNQLEEFSFYDLFMSYYKTGNNFIEKNKLPEYNSYEKKLELATPVLEIWQTYMIKINAFNEIIKSLNN